MDTHIYTVYIYILYYIYIIYYMYIQYVYIYIYMYIQDTYISYHIHQYQRPSKVPSLASLGTAKPKPMLRQYLGEPGTKHVETC
jgi:hypothetical protein